MSVYPNLPGAHQLWIDYLWEAHSARHTAHWGGVDYLSEGEHSHD